jgi:RNA polymerase sigma-70 factor (ECF subfamily)
MELHNENDLIDRFNRREDSAFTAVYYECYPFVFHFVKKLTEGSPDTKDLVADVFERLLRYEGKFKSLSRVKVFLHVATRNVCLDYLKYRRVRKKKAFEIVNSLNGNNENNPEAAFETAALRSLISEEIESLPHQCKEIFLLYYTQGLKNAEIASRLGVSEKTVSNQKAMARAKLKLRISKVNHGAAPFFVFVYSCCVWLYQFLAN